MNIDPDALQQNDDPADGEDIYAGLPWNHAARFDGHPGMVWYATVRQVPGDQLRISDWLDSLDHRGARAIHGILADEIGAWDPDGPTPSLTSNLRTVLFSAGDAETVRCDVEYDVVDPNSQVTPDGSPVVIG